MKKGQKANLVIILILAILALGGLFAYIFLKNQGEAPQPIAQNTYENLDIPEKLIEKLSALFPHGDFPLNPPPGGKTDLFGK